jgi:hypothetical protein
MVKAHPFRGGLAYSSVDAGNAYKGVPGTVTGRNRPAFGPGGMGG